MQVGFIDIILYEFICLSNYFNQECLVLALYLVYILYIIYKNRKFLIKYYICGLKTGTKVVVYIVTHF